MVYIGGPAQVLSLLPPSLSFSAHFTTSLNYSYFTAHSPTITRLQISNFRLEASRTFYQQPSTFAMPSKNVVRTRLTIIFFTLLWLAVAGLNWTNVRFSIVLRDRARSDSINTADSILTNNFLTLEGKVLGDTIFTAVVTTTFFIYGSAISVHPRWLRDHERGAVLAFLIAHTALAFVIVITGGILADTVHGFYTSFEKFDAHDGVPYYSLMYYGGVAQAAYGSFLVLLAVIVFFSAEILKKRKQRRVDAVACETMAPTTNGKEFSQGMSC